MRNLAAILSLLLLAGCHRLDLGKLPPPEAYVRFEDRIAGQMLRWGVPWRLPCSRTEKVAGPVAAISFLPDEQCYKMDPPRRWRGLWRNDFEGSQFCPAPATECSHEISEDAIWLDFTVSLPAPLKEPGGLYAVDFVGRAPSYRGIYGHLGVFSREVVVDRMITMKEIESPPKPAGEETLK